jgi:uncharacterized membrane protein YgcG
MHVDRRDSDGRPIGLTYDKIRHLVLAAFPCVTYHGVHFGKITKLPFKEIQEMCCVLNADGARTPFRPRRKSAPPPITGVMEVHESRDQFRQRRADGTGFRRSPADNAERREFERARRAKNIMLGFTSQGAIRKRARPKTPAEWRVYFKLYARIMRAANVARGLRSDGRPRVRRVGRAAPAAPAAPARPLLAGLVPDSGGSSSTSHGGSSSTSHGGSSSTSHGGSSSTSHGGSSSTSHRPHFGHAHRIAGRPRGAPNRTTEKRP